MHKRPLTLSSPKIIFYVMPYLMVLLVLGTLAQRAIGLYEAERLFFASWVVWYNIIPMPGVYTILGIITVPLIVKTFWGNAWNMRNGGIILTHLGALLLLIGGMLTALTAEEGFIALGEEERSNAVMDYHAREFVISKDDKPIITMPHTQLQDDMIIQHEAMPFDVRVLNYCRNCQPVTPDADDEEPRHHIAQRFSLQDTKLSKQDEENQTGAMLRVTGASDERDGVYLAFESLPHPTSFALGDHTYTLAMQKTQRELPFDVTLHAVEKLTHLGSDMAREYQSSITIHESDDIAWQALIRMNEPLRVQGYTLYQASLEHERERTVSVLAVVKNEGWLFPYIASFLMGVGLIWHSYMRIKERSQALQEES